MKIGPKSFWIDFLPLLFEQVMEALQITVLVKVMHYLPIRQLIIEKLTPSLRTPLQDGLMLVEATRMVDPGVGGVSPDVMVRSINTRFWSPVLLAWSWMNRLFTVDQRNTAKLGLRNLSAFDDHLWDLDLMSLPRHA